MNMLLKEIHNLSTFNLKESIDSFDFSNASDVGKSLRAFAKSLDTVAQVVSGAGSKNFAYYDIWLKPTKGNEDRAAFKEKAFEFYSKVLSSAATQNLVSFKDDTYSDWEDVEKALSASEIKKIANSRFIPAKVSLKFKK